MTRTNLRLGAWTALAAALLGLGTGCDLDRLLGTKGDPDRDNRPTRSASRSHRHHPSRSDRGAAPRHEAPPHEAPPSTPNAPNAPNAPAAPDGAPSVHLAMGTPARAASPDDTLIVRPQYALSYNRARLGPSWVSWQLDASYLGGEHRHQGRFLSDESLPAGWYHVQHEDFTDSGYDRGHMVRSEERSRSRSDNDATFLLTNVLPQRHDLNAGPWLRLEDYCRTLAQRQQRELYLLAGPIYGAQPPTIGHGIAVPDAFYKIVVVLDQGQGVADVREATRVIAVIMPNLEHILDRPWAPYRTSVAEIEKRTGYTFLDRVPEALRHTLEGRVDSGPTG